MRLPLTQNCPKYCMGKVSRISTIGDYTIFFNSLFFVLYSDYTGKLPVIIRGKTFGLREIRIIHQCIEQFFNYGRTKISEKICDKLDWRQLTYSQILRWIDDQIDRANNARPPQQWIRGNHIATWKRKSLKIAQLSYLEELKVTSCVIQAIQPSVMKSKRS